MELIALLRAVARHPWQLVPGLALAALIALSLVYRVSLLPPSLGDRTQNSGTARAQVLLGTVPNLPYDDQARIVPTVPDRATLLADLSASEPMQRRIARLAGVPRAQLAVYGPASGPPAVPVPLAAQASEVANTASVPDVVRLDAGAVLPIVTIHAAAPDARTAERLAAATRTGLGEILRARSGSRPVITLQGLGPVVGRTVVGGPKRVLAPVAFLLVAIVWCGGIALVDGLRRRPRGPTLPVAAERLPLG